MPYDTEKYCIYECNKGIKCEHSDCSSCPNRPKKKNTYYASGMTLVDGKWQSCGWSIEADSFLEAAQIAANDEKFRIHSLSTGIVH